MKQVLLIIIILLITPYYSFSDEYIIIRVCKAVAGCPLNVDTGECPTCVTERIKINKYNTVKMKIKKVNRRSLFDCELCVSYLETWR
jgi:hypothetical protein